MRLSIQTTIGLTHAEPETEMKNFRGRSFVVFIIYFGSYAVMPIDATARAQYMAQQFRWVVGCCQHLFHWEYFYTIVNLTHSDCFAPTPMPQQPKQPKRCRWIRIDAVVVHASVHGHECLGCMCVCEQARHIRLQSRTITHAVHKILVNAIFHVHIQLVSSFRPILLSTLNWATREKMLMILPIRFHNLMDFYRSLPFHWILLTSIKMLRVLGFAVRPPNHKGTEIENESEKRSNIYAGALFLFGRRQFFAFDFGECCVGSFFAPVWIKMSFEFYLYILAVTLCETCVFFFFRFIHFGRKSVTLCLNILKSRSGIFAWIWPKRNMQ